MSSLSTFPASAGQDVFTSSSTASQELGAKMVIGSREFRYVKAGAAALVPGKLYQSAAEDTSEQDLTPTATAIGATSLTTSTTVTVTENQYAGGWVIVTVTPGQGYQYKIKSHPAATAAALTLQLEDPILVALTTNSRIDLVANPYSAVIINPTTLSAAPIGAAVYPVAANEYGWVQVRGPAALLADGANAVGADLVASNGVAGAVEDAASPGAQPLVGVAMTGCADAECGAVYLMLS